MNKELKVDELCTEGVGKSSGWPRAAALFPPGVHALCGILLA